jgi:hypothetical protein
MSNSRAVSLGVATFAITLGLCVVLFLALDIGAIYLLGAAIAAAAAASGVYYAATSQPGNTPGQDRR